MAQATGRSSRVVGDYIVGKQIGAGSFSVVWHARHKIHGTEVAIKEISMLRLNKKLQDSLMSEIYILKRINHANIIALHDIIQMPCFSVEYFMIVKHAEAEAWYHVGNKKLCTKIGGARSSSFSEKEPSTIKKALLSGCSAGGLATILHCDQFRGQFPRTTKVKCLSDAGLFLDAADVSCGNTVRNFFNGVVRLQGAQKNLPRTCTNHLDPTSCFFPQNLIASVRTPLFILNTAYDSWQIQSSLAPSSADPHGNWRFCRLNYAKCSGSQIQFLQGFRNHMLNVVRGFSRSNQNGMFINSCFAHWQSERPDTWFADNSPVIGNKLWMDIIWMDIIG